MGWNGPFTIGSGAPGASVPMLVFEGEDGDFVPVPGSVGPAGATGVAGFSANLYLYRANTGATSGYPGDGKVIWDNATQTLAQNLLLAHLTDDNLDIDTILSTIEVGRRLLVQDRNDSTNYQVWRIVGAPFDTNGGTATSFWTFPVTLLESAGTGATGFANNHQLFVAVQGAVVGPQGPPGFAYDGEDGSCFPVPGDRGSKGDQGLQGPPGFAQDGEDGDSPFPVPGNVGATGATGTGAQGTPGVPGFDGEDGFDGFPMPGPAGTAGQSIVGAQGVPGFAFDGEDGADALTIPGNAGPAGTIGSAGAFMPGIDGEEGEPGVPLPGNPGVAPGSNTYIIFNDGGLFGADAGFAYDKAADTLTVLNTITAAASTKLDITANATSTWSTADNSGGSAGSLTVKAGASTNAGSNGGSLTLGSGNGGNGSGATSGGVGGNYTITTGNGGDGGTTGAAAVAGSLNITGGTGGAAGTTSGNASNGGALTIVGGTGGAATAGTGTAGTGGNVTLSSGFGGPASATGTGGAGGVLQLNTRNGANGTGSSGGGASGLLTIATGTGGSGGTTGAAANAGNLNITGGNGGLAGTTSGDAGVGGPITITTGSGGAATAGSGAGGAGGLLTLNGGAGGAATTTGVGGAGGAVTTNGGAGANGNTTKAGGVGGNFTITSGNGGDGGTTGASAAAGSISITGGIGGASGTTSGAAAAGGSVTITSGTGGEATAGTGAAAVGGDLTLKSGTGGVGTTTGNAANAGAVTLQGGTGGATVTSGASDGGIGGAVTVAGGTGGAGAGAKNPGAGGATIVAGGAAGASGSGNANGGNLTIRAGAKSGTGTNGVLSIGETNTSAINFGVSGVTTTFAGTPAGFAAGDSVQGFIQVATQTEQETATATNRAVTPGRQHFHPSASKAWLDMDASSATPTNLVNYNVSSYTDNGAGDFTVNFSTSFSTANYGYAGSCGATGAVTRAVMTASASAAPTAGAFRAQTTNSTDTKADFARNGMVFFGDFASPPVQPPAHHGEKADGTKYDRIAYVDGSGQLCFVCPTGYDHLEGESEEQHTAKMAAWWLPPDVFASGNYKVIPFEQIVKDRTFRDAWEMVGATVGVNMDRARAIRKGREPDPKVPGDLGSGLLALRHRMLGVVRDLIDAAEDAGDGQGMAQQRARRKAVRALDIDAGLAACQTPDDLKAYMPAELQS